MVDPWIVKHTPRTVHEVVGQDAAVALFTRLLSSWTRKSKPIWLWGPSGCGKTALAIAAAKERGLELVEVNASDSRNKDAIETLVGGAVKQGSLFGTGKLVLIDEIDGLAGNSDRGGVGAILDAVKASPYPVVITGEDPFDQKFSALRKACELIELRAVHGQAIMERLAVVLKSEGITYEEGSLEKLSALAGGDLRAALNDAQACAGSGRLTVDDLSWLGSREQTVAIQDAMLRVFKSTKAELSRGAFDHIAEDVSELMLWMDHNLPVEYAKVEDIARGFDALSRADVFLGRIRRWQHYRYYVYVYDLLGPGVALAKTEKYKGVTKYERSDRILKIWMAKQKHAKRKAVAEKVAAKTHCSTRRALADMPFLQQVFLNDKTKAKAIAHFYDLDAEEQAWLAK